MAKSLLRFQDSKHRRKMARDAEPNKQFRREQFNEGPGEDEEFPHTLAHPELAEILRARGWSDDEVESTCKAAGGDQDMSCDSDVDGRLAALRDFLQGKLTDAEIEEAVGHARTDMGMDLPPDLPSGGRPTPGGKLTPNRPNGMGNGDARSAAMDAAMRIATDVPIRAMDSGTRDARMLNHVRGKMDAHTHGALLAQTAKGFEARWPDAAKIKQA